MLNALAGAHCALRLKNFDLVDSSFGPASMATFSALLSKDVFPELESWKIYSTPIQDNGVALLVQGLIAATCQTRLTKLTLFDIKMSDRGITALASMIRTKHFERLHQIVVREQPAVTDEGVRALARAVQAFGEEGLPMLATFSIVHMGHIGKASFVELASALIDNCPRLEHMYICPQNNRNVLREELEQMVLAAGCRHRVDVYTYPAFRKPSA